MNSISQILQKKRKNSQCALIPFLTAGYPDIQTTIDLLFTLDTKGADIIELGIPYSDALADGYLIQNAAKVALDNGVYINQVLGILREVNNKISSPIVVFTYYNPILVRGLSVFMEEVAEAGAKGLIIPDLPIEETNYILNLCLKYKLELILFVSPTSSKDRIVNILDKAPGCVYLVSSTGVTGIRSVISDNINMVSKYIADNTNKFVMLGFGISNPSQVSKLLESEVIIDAIVVGSAFTRIIYENCYDNRVNVIRKIGKFCEDMKSALNI